MCCKYGQITSYEWVCEMLLINSVQVSSQVDKRGNSASKTKNQSQKSQDGEAVQVITKDLIRNLRQANTY